MAVGMGAADDGFGVRAPGPRGLASLRAMRDFLRDPLDYLLRLREDWGDLVRTGVGPLVFHTLYDPRWIRHVLVDHPERYTKRGVLDDLEPLLGEGLLRGEGERWRARRRAVAPAFSPRAMEPIGAAADAEVTRWLAHWRGAQPIDVSRGATELALCVVGRALFGVDLGARAPAVSRAVEEVSRLAYRRSRALVKLPLAAPTPANRAYRAAIRVVDEVARALVVAPRAADSPDVLAPLRAFPDSETGRPLTERDLRDEAVTLLLAGHETTATTLTWALDRLAREPAVQERARGEVRATLGKGADLVAFESLVYLDAVVSETLRLHPPAWILMRRAEEPDRIGGYAIPRGSFVTLPVHALHRHPVHWPDPERFDPERFLGHPERDPLVFLPFGAGERRCIGAAMARTELRVVLARVLERFELSTCGPPPAPEPLTTLRPCGPVRILAR